MESTALVPVSTVDLAAIEPIQPDRNPAIVYLARLSPGSRPTMKAALDTIASLLSGGRQDGMTLDWSQVRYQHTGAVRAKLAETAAPATVNKMLCALRGVLKECWRLGLFSAEDFHRAVDIESVKGSRLLRGRALASGEIAALMGACAEDQTAAGIRDAAMLAVLYASGLRRAEIVNLDHPGDYDAETGALTIRSGKGNKDRVTYIADGAAHALQDWLAVRGSEPGALLAHVNKGGTVIVRRLTAQACRVVMVKRAQQAGVAPCSPHDLRRSFVSDLLDAGGADISTVAALAGHQSVITTQRYDRRGEAAKKKAAGLLHVPYHRRPALSAQPPA